MVEFELDGITPYPELKALGHEIIMVEEDISKEEYNLLANKIPEQIGCLMYELG